MLKKQIISANEMEGKRYTTLVWVIVSLVFILTIVSNFVSKTLSAELLSIVDLGISALAFIHGIKYFGLKKLLVFFVITWVVSNTFEALSVYMGFPFGFYHYTSVIPGPTLFKVPLLIMPTYFGMGYLAFMLSHIFNNQFGKKIQGIKVFLIPVIGTFIMVMWDLVIDPIATNVQNAWVWKEPGTYFGVPMSNYFGWFFVVFIFLQLFTIYISKVDKSSEQKSRSRMFWVPAIAIYGIQGINHLLQGIMAKSDLEIYAPVGLISLFTLCFVALLSIISLYNAKSIHFARK